MAVTRNASRCRPLASLLVAGLLLAGCGGDDAVGTQTTTSRVDPLDSDEITDPTDVDVTTPADTETDTAEQDAAAQADADQVIELSVTGGDVEGGGGRQHVPLGDTVALVVTSDAADEIHVHGYDLHADVVPGAPAVIEFTADIPGVFEVELHDSRVVLAELEIS